MNTHHSLVMQVQCGESLSTGPPFNSSKFGSFSKHRFPSCFGKKRINGRKGVGYIGEWVGVKNYGHSGYPPKLLPFNINVSTEVKRKESEYNYKGYCC